MKEGGSGGVLETAMWVMTTAVFIVVFSLSDTTGKTPIVTRTVYSRPWIRRKKSRLHPGKRHPLTVEKTIRKTRVAGPCCCWRRPRERKKASMTWQ